MRKNVSLKLNRRKVRLGDDEKIWIGIDVHKKNHHIAVWSERDGLVGTSVVPADVIAPSKMRRAPCDEEKCDRLDRIELAEQAAKDDLRTVRFPTPSGEADRSGGCHGRHGKGNRR